MHEAFSPHTLLAMEVALEAGEILRKGFGTSFRIDTKEGRHNLVTEYDWKAEKHILSALAKGLPDSSFLAEESGLTGKTSDFVWIVDPLDGTVNFAHGIPIFCVSIALEYQKELLTGVVFQPLLHELFVAEKGKGAFLNGEKLHVSKTPKIEEALLSTGFPYNVHENPFSCIEHFGQILRHGIPIRRLGSAALDLSYTAAGKVDGFFEVGLAPWDAAAGSLLVQEAGGTVTKWDKTPLDIHQKHPIVGTNGILHASLCSILQET